MTEKNTRNECFISVIAVLNNIGNDIEAYLTGLHTHLNQHFTDFEILLVDQCSTDNTKTIIEGSLMKIPSIRYMELAMHVHADVAIAAGMENAIGDFIVLTTPMEDPFDCIADLVQLCQAGSDVIVGVAKAPQSFSYSLFRPLIQWLLLKIDYKIPRNATSLRCLSRRAVNTISQTGRFHHQLYVRIAKTGYPTSTYQYKLNSSLTRKTLPKGLKQAVRLLVFNSTKPLRWMSGLGVLGSFMAFLFAAYSLIIHFFKDNIIEGWTSMILFMSILFMLLFLILAFFGEYLGRLLDDRSEQRDYAVAYEKNSSVMLNEKRINVINVSTTIDQPPQNTTQN